MAITVVRKMIEDMNFWAEKIAFQSKAFRGERGLICWDLLRSDLLGRASSRCLRVIPCRFAEFGAVHFHTEANFQHSELILARMID